MAGLEIPPDIIRPPKTPVLERVAACSEESHRIGEFLDWMIETQDSETAIYDLHPEKLLHEYYKIDPDQVERERRETLAYCRLVNARNDIRKELGLDDE